MIKYYKVDGVYHSKVNTETFEFEMFATNSGRVMYKKSIEDEGFINFCIDSKEYHRVEVSEEEYNEAKLSFINSI